jgi:hypothetical protein
MSDDDEMRVQVKRASKKKSGYEVEKRGDGFYYSEFGSTDFVVLLVNTYPNNG